MDIIHKSSMTDFLGQHDALVNPTYLGFLLFFAGCLCAPLAGGKDTSRRVMVGDQIQDAIMGHEPEHVSSEYG